MDFSERLRMLGYTSYRKYLAGEHWARVKKATVDQFAPCFCCASIASRPHLHHRSYDNLGRETRDDIVQVCGDCHEKIHALEEREGYPLHKLHEYLRLVHIARSKFGKPHHVPRVLWQRAKQRMDEMRKQWGQRAAAAE